MNLYNQAVVDAAKVVASAARQDFLSLKRRGAVALTAIAGGGKSHFVVDTVTECRSKGMRVAVAAPTNEQVFALAASIADRDPALQVVFVPATGVELPPWAVRPNLSAIRPAHQATGADVVIGTIDKLGTARNPRNSTIKPIGSFDALVMDEAYQANAAKYYAVAGIADRHLCVGDSGQIHPFTTLEEGHRWKGLPEDPLQTAIGVLRQNHPTTPIHSFPITRRLDGRGAMIARCFYPATHTFGAAVNDGVREMHLIKAAAQQPRARAIDKALDLAANSGWAHVELPARPVLRHDPEVAAVLVELAARLLGRGPRLVCERTRTPTALLPARIAVGVAHNDQKDLVRSLLNGAGLNGVVVDTANRLQGLEFDVSLCWHPLSGLDEADHFHLESGRMCVMCTRHRHACIVVGREGDRELVEGLPPSTPAWPGIDADQILGGWEAHRRVFAGLAPVRVACPEA